MRAVLAVVLVLFVATACRAQETGAPLDIGRFREAFIAELRRADPGIEVKVVTEDELQLRKGEYEARMYLGNAYAQYTSDPARLDEVMRRYSAFAVRLSQGQADAKVDPAKVVVLVRPSTYLENRTQAKAFGPTLPLAHRPFVPGLMLVIGQDEGDSFRYPFMEDIEAAFDGDLNAAWSAASAATRRRSLKPEFERMDDGLVLIAADEGMAGGLLVQDEVWARPELSRLGARLAATAGKDVLLVANADDPRAVSALKALVARFPNDVFGSGLLVRERGAWKVMNE